MHERDEESYRLQRRRLRHSANDLYQRVGRHAIREIIGQTGKSSEASQAIKCLLVSDEVLTMRDALEEPFEELLDR